MRLDLDERLDVSVGCITQKQISGACQLLEPGRQIRCRPCRGVQMLLDMSQPPDHHGPGVQPYGDSQVKRC